MAYYNLYNNAPAWGTRQYQFVTPPAPSYQPQPAWGGIDYYHAHAGNDFDNAPYDYAWNRVRNYNGGVGTGPSEAQYWHRCIYGGLGDIRQMLPPDIGAAAAFEAWRNWQIHYGVYGQPLSGDREREREALVGLAAGEATRLWRFKGRLADRMGLMQACEIAAQAASRIYMDSLFMVGGVPGMDMDMGMGMGAGIGGAMDPLAAGMARPRSAMSFRSLSRAGTPFSGEMGGIGVGGVMGGVSAVPGMMSGAMQGTMAGGMSVGGLGAGAGLGASPGGALGPYGYDAYGGGTGLAPSLGRRRSNSFGAFTPNAGMVSPYGAGAGTMLPGAGGGGLGAGAGRMGSMAGMAGFGRGAGYGAGGSTTVIHLPRRSRSHGRDYGGHRHRRHHSHHRRHRFERDLEYGYLAGDRHRGYGGGGLGNSYGGGYGGEYGHGLYGGGQAYGGYGGGGAYGR